MPVLVPLNIHTLKADEFDTKTDLLLIAAYNKLPHECTAENLIKRDFRVWLLKITDEVNAKSMRTLDHCDYLFRLQQLRKAGRLGNRSNVTRDSVANSVSGLSDLEEQDNKDADNPDESSGDGVSDRTRRVDATIL